MSKLILDLCGGTGSWSKPYKDAGYEVHNITLPDFDVTKWKEYIEVVALVQARERQLYGILAAPPCTEFSLALNNRPRDLKEGMKIVQACMEIIWRARENSRLQFWALENPRGFLRQFLGKPALTVEQWQFGDKGIKPTDLWGFFNEPRKTVKTRPAGLTKKFPNGRTNGVGWSASAEKRATTPPGFAEAFYKANK